MASQPPNLLDAGSVSVPYESLKRVTRERKYMIEEAEGIGKGVAAAARDASLAHDASAAHARLDQLLSQLQGLKRKLEGTSLSEREDLARCRARLQHLRDLGAPDKDAQIEWNRRRLDSLLVDHMLRGGYNGAAAALASSSGIQPLVELHIFEGAQSVVDALRAHNCGPALAWCEEQRPRLRKAKSKLEFKLRVQEFVELVRAGQQLEAIAYARRHLAPWASQYLPELQRAAALLAFQAGTQCAPYKQLFDDARWGELVELFRQELYRLNTLPPTSLLSIHLQAGLSALKTPLSLEPGCCREDPLHLPAFRTLAEGLPFAKHVHSKLICAISHTLMNEHNPPAALPNGYVYSQKALHDMAAANGGRVTCPRTGFSCDVSELRRVYIS
ncbi:macrophage erythroblast attacher [Chlorella sorokiniana]|uniref:Macrophage erythroblast attacher n=1 Tax=Chlorella sorokiniana TaxID=3076 RepID=A0A2P6TKJ7_CHLSO|nr:macrophage erythroblast attacher [Chlorella sorokiniana]|eukprot:PRW44610.1 macrophage erythroblast attacher [Chlorella sorokiniana]